MVNDSELPASKAGVRVAADGSLLSRERSEDVGPIETEGLRVVESCQSIWLFNEADRLFTKAARGSIRDSNAVEWRPYDRLVFHPRTDAFIVFLDAANTRVLRSWRHREPCPHCGGEVTSEMSVNDLREALDS